MTQTGEPNITIEFKAWGKTPRLFRDITITEKIDGTNAAVIIEPLPEDFHTADIDPSQGRAEAFGGFLVVALESGEEFLIGAQSRKRLIFPGKATDNYGFAGWVKTNAVSLVNLLGVGYHYGEWWGQGIQGNPHGVEGKRFDLFNVHRYADLDENDVLPEMGVVPTLYVGPYSEAAIRTTMKSLSEQGSVLPGTKPGAYAEGVITFHSASGQVYKSLLESDHLSKTEALGVAA